MRKKIVAVCSASILLLIAIIVRKRFFPQPSHEVQYYFTALLLTAVVLIVIWCAMIIHERYEKKTAKSSLAQTVHHENRRNNYRIFYRPGTEPVLHINQRNENSNKTYQLKIINLSETGAKIQHNGLLKKQDIVSGHIFLTNSEKINVSGKVIRIAASNASLKFTPALPPQILIEEQRRQIFIEKSHTITARNI